MGEQVVVLTDRWVVIDDVLASDAGPLFRSLYPRIGRPAGARLSVTTEFL
jgi:hypothetical protein